MRNDSLYLSRLWLAVAILLVAPALASAQTSFVQPRITVAIDNTSRVTIPHSTHPLALPANETGRLDGTTPMQRMILAMDGSADQDYQLTVLLDSQQTQGSPDFHQWLTPDEFGQKFGPAPQDIQIVTGWLQQRGFSVDKVARSGRWIEFSGTAAQVESAFQTQMHTYQAKGEAHVANSTDISIPAALAPVVRGVVSLHNFFSKPAFVQGPLVRRADNGTYTPVHGDTNLMGGIHGLAPADFAKIYDVPNLLFTPTPTNVLNGTGETIAIVARSDISAQDVADFRKVFGLPAAAPNFILDGEDPGVVPGDNVETTLDTEWSSAVAPGATIDVVISASTLVSDGVDLSAAYIVDQNLAPIMSASFNDCEPNGGDPTSPGTENFFLNSLWQQASAQSISVFVSSGDSGAASCDPDGPGATGAQNGVAVSGLASTPWNTAVGGTEFNELGAGETPAPGTTEATFWGASSSTGTLESALGYIPEMVWNDSCTPTTVGSPCDISSSPLFGAFILASDGGGISTVYATPSYQTLGVANLQTALNAFTLPGSSMHPRGLPDVSLTASADNDPYLVCITASCETTPSPSFALVGGTSASSPSFAGIMALVDQKIAKPQGLANYVLYPLAAAETYSSCNSNTRIVPATATTCVFNDITVGNNGVPGNDITGDPIANALGYPATAGYDLATGLGSVDVNNLLTKWNTAAAAFAGSATALSPTTSINITHGASVTVTAKVTKAPTGTGPTGNVSLIAEGGNLPNTVGVAASGLTSGSATFTLNNLPGGTNYNLIASYPGDGTFAGSTSNAIAVTVAKEASAVELIDALPTSSQLTGNPLSTTYGFPIAFEALISGVSSENSATGDGQATGTVTFTDTPSGGATTNLATIALNDFKSIGVGGAEFFDCSGTQNCFAPGTHAINGAYSGDNSYLAGNSSTGMFSLAVTITSASTVTTITAPTSGTSVNQGTSVALTATVSTESAGVAPNGTVTFFSGTTQLGSPVTVSGTPGNLTFLGVGTPAGATATLMTTTLPTGTDSITAKYNGDTGDTNYAASGASAPITITVTGPTFTIAANPTTVPVTAPGASGTTMLTFTAINGFNSNGAVTVTPVCTGLPSETTCSSGSMITIATNGTATAMLSFQTTAPSSVFPASRNRPIIPGWRTATASALALACLLCALMLAFGYRGKQRRWGLALVFTIFVMLAVGVGCGGGGGTPPGSGNPGTPTGMSSPTVSITINGVTETVPNLVLNVQ